MRPQIEIETLFRDSNSTQRALANSPNHSQYLQELPKSQPAKFWDFLDYQSLSGRVSEYNWQSPGVKFDVKLDLNQKETENSVWQK